MYFLRAVAKKAALADPARPGRSLSLIFHGDLNDSAVVKLRKISVFEHEVVAMSVSKKPMVLVILDGYGYREDQQDNAIYSAKTPVMDALWAKRPHTLIDASGLEVGLPDRQMGNSEVGHVNLGAGRIVYQDLTRLDVEIKERTFFANPVLTAAVDKAVAAGKAVHIMGLMSPGGVHSHEDHIMAMVELAAERGAEKIYLHAFLDGRDTPPRSAEKRWRHSKPNLPRWAKVASHRSSAAITPWTATTAGIA